MAIYPGASFAPLHPDPDVHPPRMGRFDLCLVHTMVFSLEDCDRLFRVDNGAGYDGSEAHFGLGHDGTVIQWVDTRWQAECNGDANTRAISIECADRGQGFPDWDPNGSNVPDFTAKQVEALVDLIDWICRTHDIPRSVIPDSLSSRRGLGWHRLGVNSSPAHQPGFRQPGGEKWSKHTGKVCPGDRRIATLKGKVFPRVAGQPPRPVPAAAVADPRPTWEQLWEVVRKRFPTLRLTSEARDNDSDYHGRFGVNDHCAIDLAGPNEDDDGNPLTIEVTTWIARTYPDSTELIHTPAGPEVQLKNGRRHLYSADVRRHHNDHIHWAYDLRVLPAIEEDDMPYTDWPERDRKMLQDDIHRALTTRDSADVFRQPGAKDTLKETMFRISRMETTLNELKGAVARGNTDLAALLAKPEAEVTDEDIAAMTETLIAAFGPKLAQRVGNDLATRVNA